ncbi:hypothetical protein B0H10DRAFT_1978951 [Mycena sp. CBHHK59/15]|nr:hypothetical protein B0H10DRAFT_1978951 [Mycena sp. CBHHK59/15]
MVSIDYATLFGFHSVAAAAIFAALYLPLFLWFIRHLFTADEVLFGVGFFALLYSAYTLVLDRSVPSIPAFDLAHAQPSSLPDGPLIGVILGVVGITNATSSNANDVSTSKTLRKASTAIFLVLTVLQALQAFIVVAESRRSGYRNDSRPFGDRHGSYLLCLISVFLLVREVFLVATISNQPSKMTSTCGFRL